MFFWLAFSGNAVKIVMLTAIIVDIVLNRRFAIYIDEFTSFPPTRRRMWMGLQIVTFAGFYLRSQRIFHTEGSDNDRILSYFWILSGLIYGIFMLLAIAAFSFWIHLIVTEKGPLLISFLIAGATFTLSTLTADLTRVP